MNPFERFYDTEIGIYEKKENSYEKEGELTFIGNIVCDIQPVKSDTQSRVYGLSSERLYKLFCDKNDLIKIGRYVNFGGIWHMIVNTEIWNFGMTALMRSNENEG